MNKFKNATPTQMTEAMAEGMRRVGDGCTAHDLKLLGFTDHQVDLYSDAARELAMAKSDLLIRARIPARRAA